MARFAMSVEGASRGRITEEKYHVVREMLEDITELLKPGEELVITAPTPGDCKIAPVRVVIRDANLDITRSHTLGATAVILAERW